MTYHYDLQLASYHFSDILAGGTHPWETHHCVTCCYISVQFV